MFRAFRHGRAVDALPPDPMPDVDELAPTISLVWGDLSEIWMLCALNPTRANAPIRRRIEAVFVEHFGEPLTLGDVMSLFDREPNFEETFTEGDRFALMSLQFMGQISTVKGPAKKTLITVITRESYPNRVTYSALGEGFAAMAQRAQPGDFPVIVEYARVPLASGNSVKRLEPVLNDGEPLNPGNWRQGDDGDPIVIEAPKTAPGSDTPTPGNGGNIDPGF